MLNKDTQIKNNRSIYYKMHIFCLGRRYLFRTSQDYEYFLSLISKYFTQNDAIDVMAYCMVQEHCCLLVRQVGSNCVVGALGKVTSDYNDYYSKKYGCRELISSNNSIIIRVPSYKLLCVSRNIHLLPTQWLGYPHSSIRAYLYGDTPKWLDRSYLINQAGSAQKYLDYIRSQQVI